MTSSPPSAAPSGDQGANSLRRYLADRPAWRPVLDAALKRYRTYNGLRGTIVLETLPMQEVVRGIKARVVGRRGDRVHVAELDRAFREETRFACGLVEVLSVYTGGPIATRVEQRSAADAAWAAFCGALVTAARMGVAAPDAADAVAERVRRWMEADAAYLQQQLRRDPDATHRDAVIVARALGQLAATPHALALPVLAQWASGNPHALDRDAAAGRYFERALAWTQPDLTLTLPLESAEERELLLASANIAVDDVSSSVHVFHVTGDDAMLATARDCGYIVTLPLATVDRLPRVTAARDIAYVVENPAVFSTLVRWALTQPLDRRPTLVCTSGQLSLAARRFLDALVCGGAQLWYGGDFDHMGLTIAYSLVRRWPGAVHLWRMSDADCARAQTHDVAPVPPERLEPLRPIFPGTVARLIARGPAYQEALLDLLEHDLRTAVSR